MLPTGGSWIVELECAGSKLFLTTHQPPAVAPGEPVRFAVGAEALHVFDRDGSRAPAADENVAPARMN